MFALPHGRDLLFSFRTTLAKPFSASGRAYRIRYSLGTEYAEYAEYANYATNSIRSECGPMFGPTHMKHITPP